MKKIITMIICIVMVAAVFAGCGASQGTAASSQPTQSAAAGINRTSPSSAWASSISSGRR